VRLLYFPVEKRGRPSLIMLQEEGGEGRIGEGNEQPWKMPTRGKGATLRGLLGARDVWGVSKMDKRGVLEGRRSLMETLRGRGERKHIN